MAKARQFFTKYHTWFYGLTIIAVFVFYFLYANSRIEFDFGWHLVNGQHILHNNINYHDTYSYAAPGFLWINHSWLSDILYASVFRIGGYTLLAIVFAAIWSVALVLASKKYLIIPTIIAAIALLPYADIRPMAWTVLLLVLLLRIVQGKPSYKIWFVPLLFLVWANLHGGFLVGLIVLTFWQFTTKTKLPWWTIGLCWLAPLLNPYGLGLYALTIRTITNSATHRHIGEWRWLFLPTTTWLYMIAWVGSYIFFDRHKLKNLLSIPWLLLVTALSGYRNGPLFVVGGLEAFENYYLKLIARFKTFKMPTPEMFLVGTFVVLFGAVYASVAYQQIFPITQRDSRFPIQSVNYLQDHPCSSNIFNSGDYGGYLEWKLPGKKTFIDGRMDVIEYRGQNMLERYIEILNDSSFRSSQFSELNVQCVLVKPQDNRGSAGIVDDLQASGWQTVVSNKQEILLIKPQ